MTGATAIAEAQKTYDDLPSDQALSMLQDICDDLCRQFPLVIDTLTFSSIVAGTPTYSLNEQTQAIESCTWWRSATSKVPLDGDTTGSLAAENRGWDSDDASTPQRFYKSVDNAGGIVIGFYPKPDKSTSSGYPKATARVYLGITLTTSATVLPALVPRMVWIDGLRAKWSERRDRDNAAGWAARFEDGVKLLAERIDRENRRYRKQITPESYCGDQI